MKIANTIKMIIAAAACAGLVASCAPSAARAVKKDIPAVPSQPGPEDEGDFVSPDRRTVSDSLLREEARRIAAADASVKTEDRQFGDSMGRIEFEEVDETGGRQYADRAADTAGVDAVDAAVAVKVDTADVDVTPPAPAVPVHGGRAVMYLQRGFIDDVVADLLRVNPFGGNVTGGIGAGADAPEDLIAGEVGAGINDDAGGAVFERHIFNVTDSTHRRLEFTMTEMIRRADGRRVTALDFVELWSNFLKRRPAQGLALFRNVQGAEEFVSGKAPLVNGFSAADERVVKIRLGKPDPLAFHRMNTPKLIGGTFMLGAYYSARAEGAEARLLPNSAAVSGTAFLEECLIQTGGDPKALESFFLGRYSAMTLYAASDLDFARTELGGKATLHKLPSERYFLSCRAGDEQIRRFVRRYVNGADLLKNVIGAEGEEIYSITSNVRRSTAVTPPQGSVPQLPKPFRIIYRKDDPISKTVAEKVSADLTGAGMHSEIIGAAAEGHEFALVRGEYGCAVGWVSESVLENFTEQLHTASIWFNDDMDSQARLLEYREIPLFSVHNYLLLRDNMGLHGGRLNGIWADNAGNR